ncbi:hypothetical protein JCM31826_06990 [Thermaurantimonas aggregans]|uniref:Acyl-CoA dehydrogenase n=1 Tax=Thermaurantimonas aggregans TaxID=2173829 RepID=A0A401XJK2_9FLAO|nr:hypothetical protein [Thermaurantimonas aggregans]MCX8149235.1 hypothetical protein [Thermaurantimonas aggregans]GCD77217.1 hypothetical protein JCM31826_06990 [Thermaurantimonas aggregans]
MLKYSVFNVKSINTAEINLRSELPERWQNELKQGGWLRIFLPKALKGAQLSLPAGLEVLYKTAKINGSLGWRVNLGAGAGFFAGSMPFETAEQVYGAPDAVVAGSGSATGKASRQPFGWKVSGAWTFCTGALSATAFTVNAKLPKGEVRTFILHPDQISVVKNWPYWALKATETYAIEAKDALVPYEYSFTIGQYNNFPDYSLYDLDFMLFARFCMSASLLGMAAGFLEEYKKAEIKDSEFGVAFAAEKDFELYHSIFKSELWNLASEAKKVEKPSDQKSLNSSLQKLIKRLKPLMEIKSLEMMQTIGLEAMNETLELHQKWKDFLLAGQHFLYK